MTAGQGEKDFILEEISQLLWKAGRVSEGLKVKAF